MPFTAEAVLMNKLCNMVLLLLLLVFFLFSIGQLIQDNGVRSFRDVSFWLIIMSFAVIASFVLGNV